MPSPAKAIFVLHAALGGGSTRDNPRQSAVGIGFQFRRSLAISAILAIPFAAFCLRPSEQLIGFN
jgi:hypothetical protein